MVTAGHRGTGADGDPAAAVRCKLRVRLGLLPCVALAHFWVIGAAEEPEVEKDVVVSMNKVWPFANPTETYRYYNFPFCQPNAIMPHFMTLGQVLRGDRLENSIYKIEMQKPTNKTIVCSRTYTRHEIAQLKAAIDADYMFELFVAELPIVRPFGAKYSIDQNIEGGPSRYFLVSYLDFSIGYNGRDVVSANVTDELNLEHLTEITDAREGTVISFSYSVHWANSPHISPSMALELQLKATMPHGHQNMDVHWLAIINSFVLMLLILALLVLIIIRVVRSDLSQYLQIPDQEINAVEEDSGWKLLHADVFRAPMHRLFFCAFAGSGLQLFSMVIMVVLVGCIGVFYQRGAVASAAVVSFMITAAIGGYSSAHLYQKLGGEKWAWNILVTALTFSGPAFTIWSFLNTVAIIYGSTAAFPFPTIFLMCGMWACVTFPLTVLGGIMGRHRAMKQHQGGNPFPCKTNKLAREIPSGRWYQMPVTQAFATGFLPFSAIYIELHYIFNSVWGTRIYSLYGILGLAFIMLMLVAATVVVLFTYLHLNAEDHRWWWRSFGSGASVAMFFYAYCIYFFLQTGMTGFFQCSFFFLYSLLVAYGLALLLGAVAFYATYFFVVYIYSVMKSE